jgi:hypothetical protein
MRGREAPNDIISRCAWYMRTDYYVVSPNSRAYTRGWAWFQWKGACDRAWSPKFRCKINASVLRIVNSKSLGPFGPHALGIIKIQFHNNLQPHLLGEHPCFEHTQILTELVWHLTTKYPWHGRSVPLHISIFSILRIHNPIIRSLVFGL